jgi:hypothetical protein
VRGVKINSCFRGYRVVPNKLNLFVLLKT